MTWGEWKRWMERHGVKDDDEIMYIDCMEPQDIEFQPTGTKSRPHDKGWAVW